MKHSSKKSMVRKGFGAESLCRRIKRFIERLRK
jgi:hypothetical protein